MTTVLIEGCQKKPGGQVVAVVNNAEITQKELRSEAQLTQVPAGIDPQAATGGLLQRVIDRNLLADYARNEGLDREPDFVSRRRLMEQTLLADLAVRKIAASQKLPSSAEVKAFIDANPSLYAERQKLTLDQIRFATPRDPKQVRSLTPLSSMDAVAQQLNAMQISFERGTPVVDTGVIGADLGRQILRQPNGAPFLVTAGGMTFISAIQARQPAATPSETWTDPATTAVSRRVLTAAINAKVADLRKQAKISYDPAFQPDASRASASAKPPQPAP